MTADKLACDLIFSTGILRCLGGHVLSVELLFAVKHVMTVTCSVFRLEWQFFCYARVFILLLGAICCSVT